MINQWDLKFQKEGWTMPFGSLLNAYAQMHQQKPVEIKQFIEDAEDLYGFAIFLIDKRIEEYSEKTPTNGIDPEYENQ